MDLPGAMPEEVTDQIIDLIGCSVDDVIPASGKTGLGVDNILKKRLLIKFLLQKARGSSVRSHDF